MNHSLNGVHAPRVIKVRGIVRSGIGESKLFTEIPWVRRQFTDKLGIDAYPGTLNIIVLPEDRDKLNIIKNTKGVEIIPEHVNFYPANSFKALINGKIQGAVVIPLVSHYPEAQLEIISSEHVSQCLRLKDGDAIEVEVYL